MHMDIDVQAEMLTKYLAQLLLAQLVSKEQTLRADKNVRYSSTELLRLPLLRPIDASWKDLLVVCLPHPMQHGIQHGAPPAAVIVAPACATEERGLRFLAHVRAWQTLFTSDSTHYNLHAVTVWRAHVRPRVATAREQTAKEHQSIDLITEPSRKVHLAGPPCRVVQEHTGDFPSSFLSLLSSRQC
jgi:hypothetical protein